MTKWQLKENTLNKLYDVNFERLYFNYKSREPLLPSFQKVFNNIISKGLLGNKTATE